MSIVPKSQKLLFGYVSPEFINIYSEDNPLLNPEDTCYFLLTNLVDIHYPMIAKGIIKQDMYTNDLDKSYFIQIQELFESEDNINRYFHNQTFESTKANVLSRFKNIIFKKHMLSSKSKFFEDNLVRIDGFFVRPTYTAIFELRKNYVSIIKNDLQTQLMEIKQLEIGLPNPISYNHK